MAYPDTITEIFTILGAPARLYGRLPFATRYLWFGFWGPVVNADYARSRYGGSWHWRPWLFFDMQELESLEDLINAGTDEQILWYRKNQLEAFQMVSIVGALVAGAALTTQQLPGIDQVSYVARAFFISTLLLSLLATFFTVLQQRTYGFLEEPAAIRAWLTNGVVLTDSEGRQRFQSSIISLQLLQVPFELLCTSITSILVGIGIYLGSSLSRNLNLGSEDASFGNRSVLIAILVVSFFILALLGQLLGGRDFENRRCRNLTESFRVLPMNLDSGEKTRNCKEHAGPLSSSVKGRLPRGSTLSTISSGETKDPGLIKALHVAVEAHRACAAADAEVARWYEKMFTH